MNELLVFLCSVILSFISSSVLAALFAWPRLSAMPRDRALVWLVAPHMFLRFIGLSFLVPGVVSPALPAAFAVPAAYGDLIAGVLAILATVALSQRALWTGAAIWIFNTWGAADLLFAFYAGPHAHIHAGDLGAAFFLPTAIVPPLLVSHWLTFRLLVRKGA